MEKSVLITGASGFVGACLARRLLKENYKIHIITRQSTDLWRLHDVLDDIEIHNLDFQNSDDIAKLARIINVDRVYHLATYGGYHYQSNVDEVINTNVIGTFNLFREFSKKGLEMFINTSSSSEYGEKLAPMCEDMNLSPNNMYGASKVAGTTLCSTYAKINKLPLVTLRLFSPYGYYDAKTRLIPTVITSCLLGKEVKLSRLDSVRDFIFIDDVIEAYLAASKLSNAYGEIFNVGSGKQYKTGEIVGTIVDLIGNDVNVNFKNNLDRQYEPAIWVSDNRKVYEKLNFKPNVDIQVGLNNTINWFKDNLQFYR